MKNNTLTIKRNRWLLVAMAFVLALTLLPITPRAYADELPDAQGGESLASGTYHIKTGTSGVITISPGAQVTLVGNGVGTQSLPATPYVGLKITVQNGAELTLQDAYLTPGSGYGLSPDNLIDTNGNCTIITKGTVCLDNRNLSERDSDSKALIHIPATANVAFKGDSQSAMYIYKGGNSTGIGSNSMIYDSDADTITNPTESSGAMTFKSGRYFLYGSQGGAVVGNSNVLVPAKDITFDGATVYVHAHATGAAIGSSSSSLNTPRYPDKHALAGNVYMKSGLVWLWSDWQGSSVGRAGSSGLAVDISGGPHNSDHSYAGKLIVSGGSLKSIVGSNAATYWFGLPARPQSTVTTANITAEIVNEGNQSLALFALDLGVDAMQDQVEVTIDGQPAYQGAPYRNRYLTNSFLPLAWPADNIDTTLDFFLTKERHVIEFGSQVLIINWDATLQDFTTSTGAGQSVWDGIVDVSWFNPGNTEFVLTSPAQLAGLAALVNGIYNDGAPVSGNRSLIVDNVVNAGLPDEYHRGAYDFTGKTIHLGANLDMGGTLNTGTQLYDGPAYMPIGGEYLMDPNDPSSKVNAVFNGTIQGHGYNVTGISGNRLDTGGLSSAIGFVGKLGYSAGDITSAAQGQPSIRELIVIGSFTGQDAVGGIVGKVGDQTNGVLIERCANMVNVNGYGEQGTGGIAGFLPTNAKVLDCYNSGLITNYSSTADPAIASVGGIVGISVGIIQNTFNIGQVFATNTFDNAIAYTKTGAIVNQSYWADGSSISGQGISGAGTSSNTGAKLAAEIQTPGFIALVNSNSVFAADSGFLNNGYPVFVTQNAEDISMGSITPLANVAYSGQPSTPVPSISLNGQPLALNVDYSLYYVNNTFPGTAQVLIGGLGLYKGLRAVSFNILPADITTLAENLNLAQIERGSVVVSQTGSEVAPKAWWIREKNRSYLDNLDSLIAQAPTLLANQLALQADVDSFVAALKAAQTDFSRAKQQKDPDDKNWERLSGGGRYETMQQIVLSSGAFTADNTDTVIVATGYNFPDALAASGLAGVNNAPIVLTPSTSLAQQAKDTINTLKPSTIYIVGGTAAISDDVLNELKKLVSDPNKVIRLWGGTREETALDIYYKGSKTGSWGHTAIIASGYSFADALSISPFSYVEKAPIFLANKTTGLSDATVVALQQGINSGNITNVVIVGGDDVVPDLVKTQLGYPASDTTFFKRLGGEDRYQTSVLIANYSLDNSPFIKLHQMCAATGNDFPDALAGAAFAGKNGAVLLLVADNESGLTGINNIVANNKSHIGYGYVLGGDGVVADNLKGTLENASRG